MALTLTVGQREIQRQADLAFKLRDYKIFLALNDSGLTADSPASEWLEKELDIVSSPGYFAVSGTLGAAIWNPDTQRMILPEITAVFKADGGDWTFNTICLHLVGEEYLHSINVESPSKTLLTGAVAAYAYQLQSFVE